MSRYCKKCGMLLEFEYGTTETYCKCCNASVRYADTYARHTIQARISQLKSMHELMIDANDESIYMTWIYLMPDCPSEEDFFDIAMDAEQYNECFDLFIKLIKKDGNRY